MDEMRFSFNIFNSSLRCGARICRVSSICQLSKFPKQLGEGCQLSLTGSNPLNQEEWIFLNGIYIPKNQLNKHCRSLNKLWNFGIYHFPWVFPYSKLNKERMLRLHQKQPPWFSMKMLFFGACFFGSPLELLEQCCAKARVRWQCQDIPPRGNLSQLVDHSLRWGFPKMVVPNNHKFSYQKWSFWGVLGIPPFPFRARDSGLFDFRMTYFLHMSLLPTKKSNQKKLGQQPNTSPQTR